MYPAKPNENKPMEQLSNKNLLDIVLYKILHIYDSPIPALQNLKVFHPRSNAFLDWPVELILTRSIVIVSQFSSLAQNQGRSKSHWLTKKRTNTT